MDAVTSPTSDGPSDAGFTACVRVQQRAPLRLARPAARTAGRVNHRQHRNDIALRRIEHAVGKMREKGTANASSNFGKQQRRLRNDLELCIESVDEFGAETVELFFVPFVRFADLAYRPV